MGTSVTRFPNGVTNAAEDSPFADLGQMAGTKFHTYFNDFDHYVAGDWTWTDTGAATHALADADGGVLLLTNAAADNDAAFAQKVGESFKFESGKKLWFEARFKVSDATQSDFVFGLQITDTTPLAVTDGVYFRKDDGDANLDFVVVKNSTATTATAFSTAANDTYMKLAFFYDGASAVYYYKDGTLLGSSVTTNLVDDEELTVSFGVQNGEAVAKTMSVDYVYVAKER